MTKDAPVAPGPSAERIELKAAIAAFAAAQSRVVEARAAVTSASEARWKAQGELERLNEEGKEPLGFDDLDGALAAIAGGEAGVMALDKTEPRRAAVASLEKKIATYERAGKLAEQALALREKDAGAATRDLDDAARAVVAAEADWPALKQSYETACGEMRALRARLGDLADAVPNMSSPHVCEVDVRSVVNLSPLYGPERDTRYGDWLAALKSDPEARIAKLEACGKRRGE